MADFKTETSVIFSQNGATSYNSGSAQDFNVDLSISEALNNLDVELYGITIANTSSSLGTLGSSLGNVRVSTAQSGRDIQPLVGMLDHQVANVMWGGMDAQEIINRSRGNWQCLSAIDQSNKAVAAVANGITGGKLFVPPLQCKLRTRIESTGIAKQGSDTATIGGSRCILDKVSSKTPIPRSPLYFGQLNRAQQQFTMTAGNNYNMNFTLNSNLVSLFFYAEESGYASSEFLTLDGGATGGLVQIVDSSGNRIVDTNLRAARYDNKNVSLPIYRVDFYPHELVSSTICPPSTYVNTLTLTVNPGNAALSGTAVYLTAVAMVQKCAKPEGVDDYLISNV